MSATRIRELDDVAVIGNRDFVFILKATKTFSQLVELDGLPPIWKTFEILQKGLQLHPSRY